MTRSAGVKKLESRFRPVTVDLAGHFGLTLQVGPSYLWTFLSGPASGDMLTLGDVTSCWASAVWHSLVRSENRL